MKMNNSPGGRTMTETRKQSMTTKGRLSSNDKKEKWKVMGTERAESAIPTATSGRQESRRDRKLALQQDVEKLKKKLQHLENVRLSIGEGIHKAIRCSASHSSTSPSPHCETSGRGAVLEEEVMRLEEQRLNFMQDLNREAICISLSERKVPISTGLRRLHTNKAISPPRRMQSSCTPSMQYSIGSLRR